jgi:hypothetical protein
MKGHAIECASPSLQGVGRVPYRGCPRSLRRTCYTTQPSTCPTLSASGLPLLYPHYPTKLEKIPLEESDMCHNWY